MKALFLSLVGLLAVLTLLSATPAVSAQGISGCDDKKAETPCNVVDPSCFDSDGKPITGSVLCGDNTPQTFDDNRIFGPNGIMTKAARLLAMVVGVAAVIMIIVGGFQYVLASGDPSNITNAKNTILYAIIGLLVALLAQAIISFVLVRL
jgi:hypothetical protein